MSVPTHVCACAYSCLCLCLLMSVPVPTHVCAYSCLCLLMSVPVPTHVCAYSCLCLLMYRDTRVCVGAAFITATLCCLIWYFSEKSRRRGREGFGHWLHALSSVQYAHFTVRFEKHWGTHTHTHHHVWSVWYFVVCVCLFTWIPSLTRFSCRGYQ